ncbi:MAG TPA: K(+)-transporting ATPase subunit F [Polyangiales bacterium]|nr:K(+)-transporting ATPase subunit F [Polyangiales bacterium]
MDSMMWLGAGLSLALLAYLFFALLYPERLQ